MDRNTGTSKDIESQTAKEKASALLKFLQEFEAFLKTQSGEIDLAEAGWENRIKQAQRYADDVYRRTNIKPFENANVWLMSIGDSKFGYLNNYNVQIGLSNLQGEGRFKHQIEQEIGNLR